MGGVASTHNCKPQSTVPSGKIRICVAGFSISNNTGRAHKLANYLATTYPETVESWYYFDKGGPFHRYVIDLFDRVPFPTKLKGHGTAPMVWIEVAKSDATGAAAADVNAVDGNNAVLEVIGGRSELQQWVKRHTSKAGQDTVPLDATPYTLSSEEVAANVSVCPANALYFKESEKLAKLCKGMRPFGDIIHTEKYGTQTAAQRGN